MKNRFPKSHGKNVKLVPILINGDVAYVNPANLCDHKRQVTHGTFNGTEVHSPAYRKVGDSVMIWPDASNKDLAFTIDQASLGVLSTKFLQANGHTVNAKA